MALAEVPWAVAAVVHMGTVEAHKVAVVAHHIEVVERHRAAGPHIAGAEAVHIATEASLTFFPHHSCNRKVDIKWLWTLLNSMLN